MHEYKSFIHRIGLIGFSNILIALSGFLLLPILTKNLSINEYGVWVQITVTLTLLPNLATCGLSYTMVRYLSTIKSLTQIREIYYSIVCVSLFLSILISLILLYFSNQIAQYLFGNNIIIALLIPFIVLLSSLNFLIINYFRTFQMMKAYSLISLFQAYLNLMLVTIFIFLNYGIIGATFALLITHLIIFLIMNGYIISKIGITIPKFKNLKEYLSFGLPTIPGSISYWIIDSSDRYLIGFILGTSFVGYYSPGYTIGNFILMLWAPFATILLPTLSKYQDLNEEEKINKFIHYSLKFYLILAIPATIILSLLSKEILLILTTNIIAMNGYLITPFVALSALFFGIYGIISHVIILNKKTKITGIIWTITAVINFVLNLIFIPYFGILGAAIVTLVSYVFAFLISLKYSLRYMNINFDFKYLGKIIGTSIFISIIIMQIDPKNLIEITITIIFSFILYFVILYFIRTFDNDEIKFFKQFFK